MYDVFDFLNVMFCFVMSFPCLERSHVPPNGEKNPPSSQKCLIWGYIGLSPFPVIVTTRIVSCLVGDSYKPSFATITGKGDNPRDIYVSSQDGNATMPGS